MQIESLSDFSEGMDRRKGRTGQYKQSLWMLQNCYVDHAGAIRKRPGLKLVKTLPNDAFGLYSAFGKLHVFQNSGYTSEPEDALVKHHTLALPNIFNDLQWYDAPVRLINGITNDNTAIYVNCTFSLPNPYVSGNVIDKTITLKLTDYRVLLNGTYNLNGPEDIYVPKDSGSNIMTGLLYHVSPVNHGTFSSEDTAFQTITQPDDPKVTEDSVFVPDAGGAGFETWSKEVQGITSKTSNRTVYIYRPFRVNAGTVEFGFLGGSWTDGVDGFIDTDNNFQGDSTQSIGKIDNETLAVFGISSVQIWHIDPNPTLFRLVGLINGGGCIHPDTIQEYDSGVIYLSDNTIMTLSKSQDQEGQFDIQDVSNKADDLVKAFISGAIIQDTIINVPVNLIAIGGTLSGASYTRTDAINRSGAKIIAFPQLALTGDVAEYTFSPPALMDLNVGFTSNETNFVEFDVQGFVVGLRSDGFVWLYFDSTGWQKTTLQYVANDVIHIGYYLLNSSNVQIRIDVNAPITTSSPLFAQHPTASIKPYPTIEVLTNGNTVNSIQLGLLNWGSTSQFVVKRGGFLSAMLSTPQQYWAINGNKALVYYDSAVGNASGISLYTFPFEVDYVTEVFNEIYVVSGSNFYKFDSTQYDDDGELFQVRAETHFLDFNSPMDAKHFIGADVVIEGSGILEILTDSNSLDSDFTLSIQGDSRAYGTLPVEAVCNSIAAEVVNYDNQAFAFHGIDFHFDVMGMV